MRSISNWILAAAALTLVTGCDQADDETPNPGRPVAQVHGVVSWSDALGAPANPHVGMIWMGLEDSDVMPRVATQAKPLTGGPGASFDLPVFAGPPADVLTEAEMEDGSVIRYSLGVVFAFDDVNADGAFEVDEEGIAAPDRPFAFSATDWLIFLEGDLTEEGLAEMFKNPEAAHAGILRARLDPCSFQMEIVDLSEPLTMVPIDPTLEDPDDTGDWDCVPTAE